MPKTPRPLPLRHLQRDRLGTYYFRLTVAGKTLRRSLRTKDAALATMLASRLNWEWRMTQRGKEPTVAEITAAFEKQGRKFDAEFAADGTAKFTGINTDDDLRRAKDLMASRLASIGPIEHAAPSHPAPAAPLRPTGFGKRFSEATMAYLDEKKHDNDAKTIADKQATYNAFVAAFGDARMRVIEKPVAVKFKQKLMEGTAGAARINKKIGHMSDFFDWAVSNGEADLNPFTGIRISSKTKLLEAVESYEPFSAEDLATIFNPTTWKPYAAKPHFHWLPILLLHTGARPNELAGLPLSEVRREQGIDYFSIKEAKNSNSRRKVPFHKALRESEFMAYLDQRRKDEPEGQLFPLLQPSKNGYAKNVSRRFNETYLPSLRMNDPLRRLYSFRSTFITRMTELNVNPAMVMALVGHYEQTSVDLSSPHFTNYQGAKLIGALRDTIDLFDILTPLKF